MNLSDHRSHPADGASADARTFGVDTVLYVDLPAWWCRLTAPVALSWKREAAVLGVLPVAGFVLGVVVGMRVLA